MIDNLLLRSFIGAIIVSFLNSSSAEVKMLTHYNSKCRVKKGCVKQNLVDTKTISDPLLPANPLPEKIKSFVMPWAEINRVFKPKTNMGSPTQKVNYTKVPSFIPSKDENVFDQRDVGDLYYLVEAAMLHHARKKNQL